MERIQDTRLIRIADYMTSMFWLWAFLFSVALLWAFRSRTGLRDVFSRPMKTEGSNLDQIPEATKIEPLVNFDWSTTEPPVVRPFKPHYHMTMGIERISPSSLVQIDKHYQDRIRLRESLLQTNRNQVLRALPGSEQSIKRFYAWMTDYLPTRFGDIFTVVEPLSKSGYLHNKVTGDKISLRPSVDAESESLLEGLGRQVEEDFLILQPDKTSGEYKLTAFVGCFPNGFDWAQKLGMSMSQIHIPVPTYERKLQKSINRFFSRLTPGQFVQRHNWSISTNGRLFAVSNVHLYKGEKVSVEEIDSSKAYLRCERQVLHRLANSEDIVMAIHTYMYPLSDIRDEGSGPALAAAIDGLQTGSSPDMYFYKRAPNWSQSVKEFLLGGGLSGKTS